MSTKSSGKRALMELRFPSDSKYLNMVHELTRLLAETTGFETSEAEKIALAVDGSHHQRRPNTRTLESKTTKSRCTSTRRATVSMIVIFHDGKPLESMPVPEFDLDDLVAERKTGGLGLTIMRQMMDKVEHTKAGTGKNKVSHGSLQAAGPDRELSVGTRSNLTHVRPMKAPDILSLSRSPRPTVFAEIARPEGTEEAFRGSGATRFQLHAKPVTRALRDSRPRLVRRHGRDPRKLGRRVAAGKRRAADAGGASGSTRRPMECPADPRARECARDRRRW